MTHAGLVLDYALALADPVLAGELALEVADRQAVEALPMSHAIRGDCEGRAMPDNFPSVTLEALSLDPYATLYRIRSGGSHRAPRRRARPRRRSGIRESNPSLQLGKLAFYR